jgi:hypothetical protein
MRGEGSPRRRLAAGQPTRFVLILAAVAVMAPAAAVGQSIRGFARVQYELQDQQAVSVNDLEWWMKTVHLDVATKLRDQIDVTAQAEWNDLDYVGRPDRQRNPRGSLRLAHRDYGAYLSYRPQRTTDANGVTTRQRETVATAYWNRAGWPRLNAGFVRRHQPAQGLSPEQTGIQRTLTATHELGPLRLRGSYGRITRETSLTGTSRTTQDDWGGGVQWSMARARGTTQLSYDLQSSRSRGSGGRSDRTDVHAAAANATRRLTGSAGASLTYAFRHTEVAQGDQRSLNDHEGAALLNYRVSRAVTATAGGGLRTARIEERLETERYALATISAQGRVRAGWTGSATATRSVNWLPGESSRLIDAASLSTRLAIVRGLEATAQSQVTSGRASAAVADTSGRRVRTTAQSGYGFMATPLRPFTLRYSWSEYRTGTSLFSPEATSRSNSWDARWSPAQALQISGTLSRSRGLGATDPSQTTKQATVQWSPRSTFQASGTYVRSDAGRLDPITQSLLGREVFGLRLLAAPGRDWRVQASLNDIDPGRSSHVRQWDLTLTRNFRR